MVKFKALKEKFFFFPLSYIIFHTVTYGVFFIWMWPQPSGHYSNFGSGNPVWFSGHYWVNWATFWVLYYFAYRKRKFKLAFCYILAILAEFILINIETVVGGLEGVPLASADYEFFITRLHFVNSETRTVIHYSLLLASAQFLMGLLRKKEVRLEHVG